MSAELQHTSVAEDTRLLPAPRPEDRVVEPHFIDPETGSTILVLDPVEAREEAEIAANHLGPKNTLGGETVWYDIYYHTDLKRGDMALDELKLKPQPWNAKAVEAEVASPEIRDERRIQTRAVRNQLNGLLKSRSNRETLNHYMRSEDTSLPDIFNKWRKEAGDHAWSTWLSKEATDNQLTNFLQWHNHHMAELQKDPEILRQIERERDEYKVKVKQAVIDGDLPMVAIEAVTEVDNIRVRIGDVFDTLMQERGGYHYRDSDYVVLDKSHIRFAAKHEFNHAVLGQLPYRWMDEAMTEHIAQSLEQGDFKKFDAHGLKRGAYTEERDLMGTIAYMIAEGEIERNGAGKEHFENVLGRVMNYFIAAYSNHGESYLDGLDGRLRASLGIQGIKVEGSAFECIDEAADRYYESYKISGMSGREAMTQAVSTVRSDLLQQPHVIFDYDLDEAA